jgi:hypothetical protein
LLQSAGLFAAVLGVALFVDANRIAQRIRRIDQQLIRDYPDSPRARREQSRRRRETSLGKLFELNFTDAISGNEFTMTALRGKVVVVDFWAT